MTFEMYLVRLLLIFLLPVCAFASDYESNSYIELERSFPDSVHLKIKGKSPSFEFCPDNTCDLIVFGKSVPEETISDLGFLYVRYFSDYTILEEWRKKSSSQKVTEDILAKPVYSRCANIDRREMARCVLAQSNRKLKFNIYAVRYDENGRHLVRGNLP